MAIPLVGIVELVGAGHDAVESHHLGRIGSPGHVGHEFVRVDHDLLVEDGVLVADEGSPVLGETLEFVALRHAGTARR